MNTRNWVSEVFSAQADLLDHHARERDEAEAVADMLRARTIRGALMCKFGGDGATGYAAFLADVEWRADRRKREAA